MILHLVRASAIGLVTLSVGGALFLAGMFVEHLRPGGTADLEDRLRTVVPFRPRDRRRTERLGRGVSR